MTDDPSPRDILPIRHGAIIPMVIPTQLIIEAARGEEVEGEDHVIVDMEDMEGEEERVLLVVRVVVDDIRVHRVWRVLVVLVSLHLVLLVG